MANQSIAVSSFIDAFLRSARASKDRENEREMLKLQKDILQQKLKSDELNQKLMQAKINEIIKKASDPESEFNNAIFSQALQSLQGQPQGLQTSQPQPEIDRSKLGFLDKLVDDPRTQFTDLGNVNFSGGTISPSPGAPVGPQSELQISAPTPQPQPTLPSAPKSQMPSVNIPGLGPLDFRSLLPSKLKDSFKVAETRTIRPKGSGQSYTVQYNAFGKIISAVPVESKISKLAPVTGFGVSAVIDEHGKPTGQLVTRTSERAKTDITDPQTGALTAISRSEETIVDPSVPLREILRSIYGDISNFEKFSNIDFLDKTTRIKEQFDLGQRFETAKDEIIDKFTARSTMAKQLNIILDMRRKHPEAFGPIGSIFTKIRFIKDSLTHINIDESIQKNPDLVEIAMAYNMVASMINDSIREKSGAAVTAEEARRLARELVSGKESPAKFMGAMHSISKTLVAKTETEIKLRSVQGRFTKGFTLEELFPTQILLLAQPGLIDSMPADQPKKSNIERIEETVK